MDPGISGLEASRQIARHHRGAIIEPSIQADEEDRICISQWRIRHSPVRNLAVRLSNSAFLDQPVQKEPCYGQRRAEALPADA